MDDGSAGSEGICLRGRNHSGVTELLDVKGGGDGDSTLGNPSGERGHGLPTGDKVDAGHTHRHGAGYDVWVT